MDIQPQSAKPISDDQELAKVLAGITQQPNNMGYEELPAPTPAPMEQPAQAPIPMPTPVTQPAPAMPALASSVDDVSMPGMTSDLEAIKKDALIELRPLVDKLELAPDEKFNIYLLLLRSTDDKTLVAPAHKAATDITDDSKRAQALLDIIKEIDYFSTSQQQ